jgi:glycosyltransferase involved in cell wall biosynthesis
MKKKLLVVSYHYPPINSAGVSRIIGFIKYLHERDWDISVISIDKSTRERSHASMLERVPAGVDVTRSRLFELDGLVKRYRSSMAKPASSGAGVGTTARLARVTERIKSWLKIAPRAVYGILTFPDKSASWVLPLFFAAGRVIRRQGHFLVLSSSPPHSSQLALGMLKVFGRFTWVADFRDGWTAPNYCAFPNRLHEFVSRRLETFVLKRCDHIIANTNGNRRELLKNFDFVNDDKITVVTNAFDAELPVANVELSDEDLDCDLMYLGEVYAEVVDRLISSLAGVKKAGGRMPRIFFYGHIEEEHLARIRENGLGDNVFYRGLVSWDKSIHLMRRARALFLLLPHTMAGSTTVPSKLYAYIFSGRPVLALAPSGNAADIVEEVGAGWVIRDKDPAKIAAGIVAFVEALNSGTLEIDRNEEKLRQYTMRETAAKLDGILCDQLRARHGTKV